MNCEANYYYKENITCFFGIFFVTTHILSQNGTNVLNSVGGTCSTNERYLKRFKIFF